MRSPPSPERLAPATARQDHLLLLRIPEFYLDAGKYAVHSSTRGARPLDKILSSSWRKFFRGDYQTGRQVLGENSFEFLEPADKLLQTDGLEGWPTSTTLSALVTIENASGDLGFNIHRDRKGDKIYVLFGKEKITVHNYTKAARQVHWRRSVLRRAPPNGSTSPILVQNPRSPTPPIRRDF